MIVSGEYAASKDEEGIERIEKNKTGLNRYSRCRGLSRDSETIRYRKKEQLSDKLTLFTDKNKTTTGTGVTIINKENGEVSYGVNAKAS